MHKFINGLSILFFTLSIIIIFKAPDAPVHSAGYQSVPAASEPKPLRPETDIMPERSSKEQEAQQARVEELEATIADLKNKLSNNDSAPSNAVTPKPERTARLLAVLSAGTFRSGQATVNENVINTVRELIPEILAAPDHRVVIEGHTDNMPIRSSAGTHSMDNMQLSFMRAKAVADILIANSISPSRISITGYGDTRPLVSNETPEGRMKNRRVEVRLVPEDREF